MQITGITFLLIFVFAGNSVDAQIQSGLEYDVYFLAGQSNAAGRGDASELPDIDAGFYDGLQTDVQFFWRSTLITDIGNLTQNQFVPLQVDAGEGRNNPGSHEVEFGPEISLGRTLADAFPQRNIAIVKYAHGGSNLHSNWDSSGARYTTFLDVVSDALDEITASGATYSLKGFAWIQGESDTSTTNSANYATNLTDLISRIRADVFGGEQAQVVVSRLSVNQYDSLGAGVNAVRAAQVSVAENDEAVEWVDTDGVEFSTYNISTPIHFDAEGVIEVGKSIGSVFVDVDGLGDGLTGDFNGDNIVDCSDLNEYVGNLDSAAAGDLAPLDLTGDGMVTIDDANLHITTLVQTINGMVGTFPGDLNCDGSVDVLDDAFVFIENLGNVVSAYADGDINFDGQVDVLGDAFVLIANLGMSNAP